MVRTIHIKISLFFCFYSYQDFSFLFLNAYLSLDLRFVGVVGTCLVKIHIFSEVSESSKIEFLGIEAWEH